MRDIFSACSKIIRPAHFSREWRIAGDFIQNKNRKWMKFFIFWMTLQVKNAIEINKKTKIKN